MAELPPSLVHELAERRCICVLGAGVSASSKSADGKRPPTWKPFLQNAAALIPGEAKAHVDALLEKERYLDAAQVLMDSINPPDFSDFIREQLVTPRYQPSRLHQLIAELDAKVVITTNYDKLYEDYCATLGGEHAFNVCKYYESHVLNDLRSTTRMILKVHGCVSDPTKVILSRTQYFLGRKEHQRFYAVLDALFLANTLLFIGCGLEDPDIALLLEYANIRTESNHPHYAIVEEGRHASIAQALLTTHNLKLIEYPAGDHDEVVEMLESLVQQVHQWRSTHD